MHNSFLVTSCLEGLRIIKMLRVMISEQNIRLDHRMFGLPTVGKSESLHFYSMCRSILLFLSQVLSKKGQRIQVFYWY